MYYITSELNTTQTIKLFYTSDRYDSLIPREIEGALQTYKRKHKKLR